MTRTMRPQDLIDSTVVDPEGSKIGKVGTVYLADDTRNPEWVTVKTGLFGHKESFVPLKGADIDDDGLHVSVAKDKVSDAPRFETDGHLSQGDSAELYRHYGLPMPRSAPDKDMGRHAGGDQAAGQRMDRTDRNMGTRAAGGGQAMRGGEQAAAGQQGMTRSEERLNVGTEQVESGRVRLHKYVVTEEQQVTVPVRHEEVNVVREPITGGARGTGRAEIGEQDQEVVLHSEKPVVNKETVEMERVRLGTETVTEEETISGKIRKEQIEVTDDTKHRKA
ncbi:PRC and DUF2382 domain-containing protein [Amycolatopsis sp.]|jgi:uncharacterized protein (TIGR02271 family)|uniref:PRC and DUF2382 domain-containing protein n=1 Tax=Amycolatopsis sp. TaxID=37632 RepID=UPI002DFECA3B|nr:PRC and DUF2382 domain-containing protein [Amycolatopsis sp.]